MKNYEVTFIVDPVLSGDEIKSTGKTYVDLIKNEGCKIVHKEEMGLKQLAYPINKRNSGVYNCVEFSTESGDIILKLELALRRDERIMRFLTVSLDKYGVKYNDDKRNGLIGKKKGTEKSENGKPAAKTVAKPETKPAAKAEAKPAEKAEAKPVAKEEVKPVATEEAKPVATEEAKPVATEEAQNLYLKLKLQFLKLNQKKSNFLTFQN
jgi:small subunit ribosomal protein S6